MAVADELVILVKAEVDKAKRDLDGLEKQTDKNKDSASKFSQFMKSPAGFIGGLTVAGIGINQLIKAGGDLINAYAVQEKALIQLNTALSNNELIADGASQRFQTFAGELQKTSVFGDEVTLSLVSQLAALGRTEDEIKKIIKASADYSSATGKDFIQTALNLSNTMSGVAGQFGRADGEVRDLTEAQLRNGEAVDIIARKYEGFASAIGKSAGGSVQQLNNAIGDLRESLGEDLAKAFTPVVASVTKLVEGIIKARAESKAYQDFVRSGITEEINLTDALAAARARLAIAKTGATGSLAEQAKAAGSRTQIEKEIAELERAIADAEKRRKDAETAIARQRAEEERAQKEKEIAVNRQKAVDEKYQLARAEVLKILEAEKSEYDKILEKIKELEKTPWAAGELENDRLEAIRVLRRELQETANKEIAEWQNAWEQVDFVSDSIYQKIDNMAPVVRKQKTEVEELQEWWEEAGKAVDKYSKQIGIAQNFVSSLGDLQSNISDKYISDLEKQRQALARNGQDTAEIENKILEAKDDAARKEFNSRKFTAIADALMQGASAFVEALPNPALAALVAGLTSAQIGIIGAQEYVPMAQGGIVNGPTRALIGEAGPEAVIPLRDINKGVKQTQSVTVNQYISGSVWQTRELEGLAVGAIAKAQRGY
jgi:septal ring factor EnvC (AmiA/AmiB activator)